MIGHYCDRGDFQHIIFHASNFDVSFIGGIINPVFDLYSTNNVTKLTLYIKKRGGDFCLQTFLSATIDFCYEDSYTGCHNITYMHALYISVLYNWGFFKMQLGAENFTML